MDFLLLVLNCLKFYCFMLQSLKIKCLVLLRYPHSDPQIDVLHLDLTRAFDTVCHFSLLLKLQRYGIAGLLLRWFTDYLSSR